jgi:EAL domain-containing protein (putative c-di-GMP-specific phosphodiesterase class I)
MSRAEAPKATASSLLIIVDDEPALLRVTKRFFERRGHRVIACQSGEEALACLERERCDVMLTDVQMPGISGLKLLKAVRERDLDIPVVLVTGNPNVTSAVEAVEYGAFQYLIKPVGNEKLAEVVERASTAGRLARVQREYVEQFGSGVFRVADRAGVEATLDRALESLWIEFQPIVTARGSVVAQEALLRTSESALPHPGAVLEAAERASRLDDVGRLVRATVASEIKRLPQDWLFFVNLHPHDLRDPLLYSANAPLSSASSRVVLEITERASLDSVPHVQECVARLREMGFRIALDDLGAGYSGLTSFVQLEPEFVKLDMSLVRDVHQSDARQKIVGSMVNLCHEMGKQIIAEGIESQEERDALVDLSCDLLQGYHFAKPSRLPAYAAGT